MYLKLGLGLSSALKKGILRYKTIFFSSFSSFLFAGFLDFRLEFLVVIFVCSPVFLWNPTTSRLGKSFSVPKMASPEARKILNPELLSKYRCVPKIGFGFKFGFEKGHFKVQNYFLFFFFFFSFRRFPGFPA